MIDKNTEMLKKLGLRILIERTKKGYSQEYLAELANISRPTMEIIERGERPTIITKIAQIAKALDIELYKLFIFKDL